MKKLITLTILTSLTLTLFAQVQLDVEGNAKIRGNLDISNGTNLFIGQDAGIHTTDSLNTFIGLFAGTANTTGQENTFIGAGAGFANTTGYRNTFVGLDAGRANTTGFSNTFVGMNAGLINTTGENNTFLGREAGFSNTTGNTNTFVGRSSGFSNTTGFSNTFVGRSAGRSNTTGYDNTFVGRDAGFSDSTGFANTFVGRSAGLSNTTGDDNTFMGRSAGWHNETGYDNTFVGRDAGYNNTTGEENTFVGRSAGLSNTTGENNTFLGKEAGYFNTTGGNFNTFVGDGAGYNNIWGEINTFVGQGAGRNNTTGNINTFVGSHAGVSSDNGSLNNSMALGYNSRVTASNTIAVGNTSITSIKGQVNFTTFSDERYKQNIKEDIPGLDFVLKLRPVTYQVDAHGIAKFLGEDEVPKELETAKNEQASSKSKKIKQEGRDAKSRIRYTGFIAQEVEKAANKIGYDFSGVDKPQNEHSLYGLRYAEFVVPLVKAVQEQQEIIEVQEEQIKKLEKNNQELQEGHQSQQQQIDQLKFLVEKLLVEKENTKGSSHILHLEQKPLLEQNQPNPFHHNTIVNYFIPGHVTNAKIQVTAVDGKVLGTLAIPRTGKGQVIIKAGSYPAGVYYYSLVLDGEVFETKRMVLTR